MLEFRFGRSFGDLEREMDRFFDHYRQQKRPIVQFRQSVWHPLVDLYETPDKVVALVELAGVERDQVEVTVDNQTLIVRGQRVDRGTDERQAYHVMEINEGPFERAILLPCSVSSAGTSAEFRNGMLEISMPKQAEQPISIKIANSPE
ncbi:MAG: Hsp20/alpha crystallin family protein [Chloroflexota bacterium]|nr:Hsp20/alpha crystallin family protein [Chloroflexota bacterium]